MPMQDIPTVQERDALASQLAILYLDKRADGCMTAADFAEKYFIAKEDIRNVIDERIDNM